MSIDEEDHVSGDLCTYSVFNVDGSLYYQEISITISSHDEQLTAACFSIWETPRLQRLFRSAKICSRHVRSERAASMKLLLRHDVQ